MSVRITIRGVVPHVGTWIEMYLQALDGDGFGVVPHVGTWIEIAVGISAGKSSRVVPHVGTWIEMTGRLMRSP